VNGGGGRGGGAFFVIFFFIVFYFIFSLFFEYLIYLVFIKSGWHGPGLVAWVYYIGGMESVPHVGSKGAFTRTKKVISSFFLCFFACMLRGGDGESVYLVICATKSIPFKAGLLLG
jgi:hypothetical protein